MEVHNTFVLRRIQYAIYATLPMDLPPSVGQKKKNMIKVQQATSQLDAYEKLRQYGFKE